METALDRKTAALYAAIKDFEQLPAPGKQTTQRIAQVRVSPSRTTPTAKGPMQELTQATYHARIVMTEAGKESRLQTWNSITVIVILGVVSDVFGCYSSSSAISIRSVTGSIPCSR